MSFASYQFFCEKTTQYMGSFSRSGLLPYCASSSAARSSASGCRRKASHCFGQDAGNAPAEGCVSHFALQLTERSPRRFSVSSALSCPAFGTPTRIPYCCCTEGSDRVGSIRPYSIGRPAYCSTSGSTLLAATVSGGKPDCHAGAYGTCRRWYRLAVLRDQSGACAVVGTHARQIGLDDALARYLSALDCRCTSSMLFSSMENAAGTAGPACARSPEAQ